jgi:hypothetical protein
MAVVFALALIRWDTNRLGQANRLIEGIADQYLPLRPRLGYHAIVDCHKVCGQPLLIWPRLI